MLFRSKKLKFVIISIDYPSLYWGFIKDRDFFYYHYYNINIQNKLYFFKYLSFIFQVYSFKPAIKLIINKPKFNLIKGWQAPDTTDYEHLTENFGKQKIKEFNAYIKSSIQSKEHEYIWTELESLIFTLKSRNIIPILVTAPCYKYYTNNLNLQILHDNLQYINKLKEKYSLVYLNSLNDLSFTASFFYDNDHLNTYGAAKFTMKIDSIINSLYYSDNKMKK